MRETTKPHPEMDFDPPSRDFAKQFIKPFKRYFTPEFHGIDEVDASRPALFVSNHAVIGVLDGYPFAIELYIQKGIFLRALADRRHFQIPLWRDLLEKKLGALEASRVNCGKVMERGESLLVFPGGTREVCKKKGEAYELKWQDRTGFVRMAMQYGYDIIPVAAVGAEDAYDVVKDSNDILENSWAGKLLKQTGLAHSVFKDGELLPPFVRGFGNTILPKPVKLYFSFGKRISTKKYKALYEDPETQELIKSKVELALLKQFKQLFDIREQDKGNNVVKRFVDVVLSKDSD
ncbi:MAG: acyltransferase family protein [Bacteroidetes bacterium]|nr:acyltransferase family protein [Bacteroidota bacterium]